MNKKRCGMLLALDGGDLSLSARIAAVATKGETASRLALPHLCSVTWSQNARSNL